MNTDDRPGPDPGAGDRSDAPPSGADAEPDRPRGDAGDLSADPPDPGGAADPSRGPPDDVDALDGIAREVAPPADLHHQVVGRLRAERLLGAPAPGRGWIHWPLAAAALVVAFVAGRVSAGPGGAAPGDEVGGIGSVDGGQRAGASNAGDLGRGGGGERGARADATPAVLDVPGEAWALLLYEDARFDPDGMSADELVAAYGAWARNARDAGVLVLAEKLGDVEAALHEGEVARRPVAGGVAAPGELTGLFVVRAPDEEAALEIARETPHHRMGGTVVVRAIDPT